MAKRFERVNLLKSASRRDRGLAFARPLTRNRNRDYTFSRRQPLVYRYPAGDSCAGGFFVLGKRSVTAQHL